MEVVVASNLTKSYGDFVAVRGIDFAIRRGECFGFLGPNGAGKTTTMRMICRASSVGSGTLSILGHDVTTDANDRTVKGRMGVVPQLDNLAEQLTVRVNLTVFTRFYGLRGGEIVVLDEPTTGLDPRAREKLAMLRAPDEIRAPRPTVQCGSSTMGTANALRCPTSREARAV